MMKSAKVSLTVLAAIAGAARAQASNPCEPGHFNGTACQAAVKSHGYCSAGVWVPQQFQKYPYYYDLYQVWSSAGGQVTAAPEETCKRSGHGHGGFGAIGAAFHAAHAGS